MTHDKREFETVPPPAEIERAPVEDEQRRLTQELLANGDPTVRLIASISQRQFDLGDMLREALRGQQALGKRMEVLQTELTASLSTLASEVRSLRSEHDSLDSRFNELRKTTAGNSSMGSKSGTG